MESARKKIMLVDDNKAILQAGRVILKDIYEVFPLPSAGKLFEVLEKVTPDLILLDIMMPEIDGFETIERLKTDSRYETIPVIFVTASTDEHSALTCLSLGAVDFVLKPFSAPDLLERIEKHLNTTAAEEAPENEKKVVLAIDDAPYILNLVNSMLNDTYKVYTLPKPEELERLMRIIKPDLFLLDYNMPEVNGLELIPIIRQHPEHKETPIVFLTGERSTDCLTASISLGACDYIKKPFDKTILRETVAKHI